MYFIFFLQTADDLQRLFLHNHCLLFLVKEREERERLMEEEEGHREVYKYIVRQLSTPRRRPEGNPNLL